MSCGLMGRRRFLTQVACLPFATSLSRPACRHRALIAITLDLEMVRHYPRRGMLEWDYKKGDLDEATKRYAVRVAERAAEHGVKMHFFLVGRALEGRDVRWLRCIHDMGHPIGNHTYDHVYLLARRPEEIQYRFRRCPWLIEGRSVAEVIEHNVRLTSRAFEQRLGFAPDGFRAPGGYATGLKGRADLQRMLQRAGFGWVSTLYPAHRLTAPGQRPGAELIAGILNAQQQAQPFRYPTGLLEIPMSPVSDVVAFRTQRWKLGWFLEVTERIVQYVIERRLVFDFLAHPACLLVEDPKLLIIDRLCRWVQAAGEAAAVVTLEEIAHLWDDGAPAVGVQKPL